MKPEILAVAQECRRDVMRARARMYWPIDLGGACFVASFHLWRVLLGMRVKVNFAVGLFVDIHNKKEPISGLEHCWVEVGRTPLDITATQFGREFPKVYVPNRSVRTPKRHHPVARNEKALRVMARENWTITQSEQDFLVRHHGEDAPLLITEES